MTPSLLAALNALRVSSRKRVILESPVRIVERVMAEQEARKLKRPKQPAWWL